MNRSLAKDVFGKEWEYKSESAQAFFEAACLYFLSMDKSKFGLNIKGHDFQIVFAARYGLAGDGICRTYRYIGQNYLFNSHSGQRICGKRSPEAVRSILAKGRRLLRLNSNAIVIRQFIYKSNKGESSNVLSFGS